MDAIDRITPDGITLKTGEEVSLDVIILATGFDLSERGLVYWRGFEIARKIVVVNFIPCFSFPLANSQIASSARRRCEKTEESQIGL